MIWPPPDHPLEGELVRLEPIAEAHREPLREAAADPRLWRYIDQRVTGTEDGFDRWFEGRLAGRDTGAEHGYATLAAGGGAALGSSSFLAPRPLHDGVEIGNTWLAPSAWRTAMEAIPARYEGTLRKHMRMPLSGPRDTVYYSVIDEEWPDVRASLRSRLTRNKEASRA